jgi:hypothetical protein
MADNTTLNLGSGGDVIASDDIAGVKHQRVKVEYGADGSATDVSNSAPLPTFDRHDGRTLVQLYATGIASGTTGTETAVPLAKAGTVGGAPAAGANSLTPPTGKRFRITSITFASRGHATATAQVTTFNIRVNAAGAVATNSTGILLQARTATPATALAWDRFTITFEDDGPELVGDGTLQWGVTANAVFVTNAPTWDVLITGYEFT